MNIDSSSAGYRSIIITKDNNYIISSNNFLSSHSIASFNSHGEMLWQKSVDIWQMVDMNGVDAFLATNHDHDTITVFSYSGDTIKNIAPPVNSEELRWVGFLAKDANYYYVCYGNSTGRDRYIFIYDNNLQYIRSFSLEANTTSNTIYGLVTIDGYIYLSQSGYGTAGHSNVVSDIFKYDHNGNMVWKNHLVDRTNMYLSKSPDGNLYMGALNGSTVTKNWLSLEFSKIDTAGNFIWDKLWFNDYPDTVFSAMWPYDFKTIPGPGGGCVISGATTKLGLGDYIDPNNIEPIMVAFNDQGNKIWELRYTNLPTKQTGKFLEMVWDAENYLITSGVTISYPHYSQELYKYSVEGITDVHVGKYYVPNRLFFSLSKLSQSIQSIDND